ncbi:MAG TPA: threonine/serine exporter family protein [Vicinamibacterales bacterium]
MNLAIVVTASLAGAHAAAMAVVFTAPREYVVPSFICGFAARLVRDSLLAAGIGPAWATLLAATVAVLVAVMVTPRRAVPPVVLVAAVVQLAASVAVFNVFVELLRTPSLESDALAESALRLNSSLGRAFTSFVAIALGLQLGIILTRRQRRE